MDKDSLVAHTFCGRYEFVEPLKPGGMARVFRVKDRSTQLTLALKLPLASETDAQANLAFTREREALEELRHRRTTLAIDCIPTPFFTQLRPQALGSLAMRPEALGGVPRPRQKIPWRESLFSV